MKHINLDGITYIRPVPYGTDQWYFGMDHDGDLYECEEISNNTGSYQGTSLFVIRFPDGEIFQLAEKAKNTAVGEPVYFNGLISYLLIDFEKKLIQIKQFDCKSFKYSVIEELPLESVKDCYNLRLHEHPLTLTRQANNGVLEVIWPIRTDINISKTESFFYREENRLYFAAWYEDPDYREETIIRDINSGEVIEKQPGDITIMPDGQLWHLCSK